ncbi:MAG: hypothetical protein P8K94_02825 [Amylibacter sp.]|nr:hypothetical protein [Amylibacter sp.]
MATRTRRMSPLKSIKTSVGISDTIASLAGVVSSSGECAIAPVAQKAINPESRKFFIFFPILLKIS